MHCERQLDGIHRIPEHRRILEVDSTGGLCKITQKMNDQYAQIMNYVFLMKDSKDFSVPGVVINETVTSRQDTTRIGEMFYLLKSHYRKKFDTTLRYRIIGMDLSWATIHAALEVMNLETVEDYARRIF
jgi:hypothetical protein